MDKINDLIIYDNNPAKIIATITFNTEFSGNVVIKQMAEGYIITS